MQRNKDGWQNVHTDLQSIHIAAKPVQRWFLTKDEGKTMASDKKATYKFMAVFLNSCPDCLSCLTNAIQIPWATLAIWVVTGNTAFITFCFNSMQIKVAIVTKVSFSTPCHDSTFMAVFLNSWPDCPSRPTNTIQIPWATWAIWAAIKNTACITFCFDSMQMNVGMVTKVGFSTPCHDSVVAWYCISADRSTKSLSKNKHLDATSDVVISHEREFLENTCTVYI